MPPRRPKPLAWLVPAVVTGGLVPLLVLFARAYRRTMGANPIEMALNQLGLLALVMIVASLACTPVKIVTGWTWPIRIRKTLGLLGFFYAFAHLLTYSVLDQGLAFGAILEDVTTRPFIAVGMAAFVLLVPLALTSTSGMLKKIGFARWKMLHRLAYVIGCLGVVHFYLREKKDVTEPLLYAAILALFFAVRAIAAWRARRPAAR